MEELIPAGVAFAFVLMTFLRAHLTFFSPAWPMNAKDEGYITAFARRLLEGHWLPYVDAVSHRGPVLYWIAAIAVGLGGAPSFLPVRVLGLTCSVLTVTFVFIAAVRARRPLAAAVAVIAIGVVLIVDQPPDDGLAYNGEPLLNTFVWGGFLCLMTGLSSERAPSLPWILAAGSLAMLGTLSRQVGVVVLLPFGLWVVAASIARLSHERGARRWSPLGAFCLGAIAPVLLVVLRYAIVGQLRTFFFYFVTYNSKYYMAPFSFENAMQTYGEWLVTRCTLITIAGMLVTMAIVRAFRDIGRSTFWQTVDREGFLLVVAICAVFSGLVANATLRDWPHYYVQAVPWFALLFGLLVEDVVVGHLGHPERRVALHLCVILPTLLITWPMFARRLDDYRASQRGRPSTLPICNYVSRHSSERDSIYVWGFAPDLYTFCKRRPASRYIYSTFQSGFVPFFDRASRAEDLSRVVPGSPGLFIADLEESRPALILDVPWTMGQRSIKDIPAYASYLQRYCPPIRYDGIDVFARRDDNGPCPAPDPQ